MYSVINVDISAESILKTTINFGQNDLRYVDYSQQAIIRGSSTVNGDSAHSNGQLEQEHNYVSFYVSSIKIRYNIRPMIYNNVYFRTTFPCYVILFKLPYKDDEDIRSKLITGGFTAGLSNMILYSHPECVLSYDFVSVELDKGDIFKSSRFLNCNKHFVVGPNDYLGVFYYCPHYTNVDKVLYKVEATAKVVFKPQ